MKVKHGSVMYHAVHEGSDRAYTSILLELAPPDQVRAWLESNEEFITSIIKEKVMEGIEEYYDLEEKQ